MQYTEEELQKILADHKLWFYGEGGKRADLSGADLIGTDLSKADLSDADLSNADLISADLSGADLFGADLFGANLTFANLSNADLSRANLFDTDLVGSNLSGAKLSGADLSGAKLSGAIFRNTLIFSEPVNKAPLKLYDLPYPVLITDTMMQIGCQIHSIDEWLAFTVEEIKPMARDAKDFYEKYGKIIQDFAISHRVPKEENKES